MYSKLLEYCKLNRLDINKDSNKIKVRKSYKDIHKDIFEVTDKGQDIELKYFDGKIENQSKESFIEYLDKQIKDFKMLRNLASSNRPLKKMKYVHNKITEMGIEYCKSKSGVYRGITNKYR